MVVGVFPIAKLGALLLRQVSKPLATFAKERAKNNHFFRTYICMPPAQFYNWCEVKTKMWVMNLGTPVHVASLNEAMAIELGANLLGESIVFAVAAGVLFFEYTRQSRKEYAKEEARKEDLNTLTYTIQELYFQAERQDAQLRELSRTVVELESQVASKNRFFRGSHSSLTSPPSDSGAPLTGDKMDIEGLQTNEPPSGLIMKAIAYLQFNELIGLCHPQQIHHELSA